MCICGTCDYNDMLTELLIVHNSALPQKEGCAMNAVRRTSLLLSVLALAGCSTTPDPSTTDQDLDGYPASTDCNDLEAATNPAASELCDGKDNNCNTQIDEGFTLTTFYADADGDGTGSNTASTQSCAQPAGYVTTTGDCDDANTAIKPSATEQFCNGVDENCNGANDDSPDLDGDGHDTCAPGVSGADAYNIDCNDSNGQINPSAIEQCNQQDDNCNGSVDEGLPANTYYQDKDLDTFGNDSVTAQGCTTPVGYVTTSGDCNDDDATVNPNSTETIGDGKDSNCNGYSDGIDTLGGNGAPGYAGDGGQVGLAMFNTPSSLTMDLNGVIYVADTNNHRIRKIDVDGTITTLAGNGTAGSLGDNGQATNAQLNYPMAVSGDGAGTLYIADTMNHKIRTVNSTGLIRTVAGSGTKGDGGDNGSATEALLNEPRGVTADPINLYISDTGNNKIKKVVIATRTILPLAGTGSAGYSGDGGSALTAQLNAPLGLTIDTGGNIFVADSLNHRIRRINPLNGKIATFAGNGAAGFSGDFGPATAASLNTPTALFSTAKSDLFLVDSKNNRIRRITQAGTITTVAGNGTADYLGDGSSATSASLDTPTGLVLDSVDNLLIADTGNHAVRAVIW